MTQLEEIIAMHTDSPDHPEPTDNVQTEAREAAKPSVTSRSHELAEIMAAYNTVTERLQSSHAQLTEQVARLQSQLASKDAQLQRSRRLAALGEMAAGIAHEIRNPLGAISLYVGMILEDLATVRTGQCKDVPPSAVQSAEQIAEAVRGLNAIVNDVLTFSRDIKPRLKPVKAEALLNRAVEAHQHAIDQAKVDVQINQPGASDIELLADPDLLHQCLLNLVRNATDALADAKPNQPRQLCLAAEMVDESVALIVRDTGPGIEQEDIDRIFNPFFTTRNTGTGLGLAIVHRIVDAHGGTIQAWNDDGAVFRILLPKQPESGHSPQPADHLVTGVET